MGNIPDLPPGAIPPSRRERLLLASRIVGAKGAIGLLSVALNFGRENMAWNKPVITEVCVAMEINGYMPIEF
ncbi:MAG: pyrroloquinoline quinone precursor peptide PqqA [Aurantimonas endophytica]|nr:coenzyme PQQ precursor peptide PqqA [Aurantimonas endophytica]MCO6405771.1 pyrroloquinoline quinone precursor peptide PqqA [Aurantimonas endophytica]